MYQPFYPCLNWTCDSVMRSGETYCDVCRRCDGYCGAAMFADGSWVYIPVPVVVSERQAVALMQEYAA